MKYKFLKRGLDIVFSFILLLILFPIFIGIAILIKFDSKGEVFFKHKRYGLNLKPIFIYKFRSMVMNAEKNGKSFTTKNDKRITKLGKILRKMSLDELPQLINILKGEMSFIGPRPDAFSDEIDETLILRSKVLPGLTGLSQVNGRSLITLQKRAELDIFYAQNYSFSLDSIIVFKTIKRLFEFKEAN